MIVNSFDLASGWLICQEPEAAPARWATAPDFDDSQWRRLSALRHLQLELLPGDDKWWGSTLREMNSTAWLYRLHFDLPEDFAGCAVDLNFAAVDYYADVWLNGECLGAHEGDFGPFSFPIESVARPGNNVLAVRVRAPFGLPGESRDVCVRTCMKGMYEHADGLIPPNVNPIGIWQPVSLSAHEGVRLGRPFADTIELNGDSASIRLRCSVTSRADLSGATVKIAIRGETFEEDTLRDEFQVDLSEGSVEISREYTVPRPKLWTVWERGRPHLYRADTQIIVDGGAVAESSATFGIRTVELVRSPEKFQFLLNGEPLFIKGTSFIPTCYLSEMTERAYKSDVDMAKAAHCNLLRVHVHIAKPEFYDVCDRAGVLVMQDSGLNWLHEDTVEFEQRILPVFREMIELLRPHPSIAFWMCYNEASIPRLYTDQPAPALYELARSLDPTRPAFIVSGQVEDDWEKSGDSHQYHGSLAGGDFWMFLEHKDKLNTEYGCTAPAARETMKAHPLVARAAANVFRHIPEIWDYQYRLIKFATENYRRQKYKPCAGCVHFMLTDMFPQIGLGVLDHYRTPKGGYYGLAEAFAPVIVSLEHRETGQGIWVVNDLQESFPSSEVSWSVLDPDGHQITSGSVRADIPADSAVQVVTFAKNDWPLEPGQDCTVLLTLTQEGGATLAGNRYTNPFKFPERPNGYPSLFDNEIGMMLYGYED